MNNNRKNSFEFSSAVVAVFAKEPCLGQVKTRLQPELGAEGALALHEELIRYVFGNLQRSNLCPVELWVAAAKTAFSSDKTHHELFLSICNIRDINIQSGVDLGVRMQHAAATILARAEYVVLVGADCPSVDAEYLREALSLLQSGVPIVIGPADDGGYVLLGLRGPGLQERGLQEPVPEFLFRDVPWGTAEVLAVTRDNLRRHNAHWMELAPRWDVDRPEDLQRLATLNPPFVLPGRE